MKLKKLAVSLIFIYAQQSFAEDLLTIYHQALEADPTSKSAAINAEIGKEQAGQALGEMLPQVNLSANWSANNNRQYNARQAQSNNYNGKRYYASVNQTLFDFAKFWNWKRAQQIEEQYDVEKVAAEHELIYKVVERYFAVLEAEDQLFFYKTEKEATEKRLEQIKKQFAKQLLKITDVYEVEAHLDQIKATEIEAETVLVTAKESLKELTNISPAGLFKLKEDVEYHLLEGKLEQWIDVARSENPTLAAQLKAISAADNNVLTQESRFLPQVDLQLNWYDTNTGFQSSNLGSNYETQVAAVNVNIPIFDGGSNVHRVFEAQHKLQLAKNENEAKIRGLIKETSDSFLSANASVRRIAASKKALESSEKSLEAMESGFRLGVHTVSDVLLAQQNQFKAKRELAQAKYAYVKNRMRFMRATGLVNEENIREVNNWLTKTNYASNAL